MHLILNASSGKWVERSRKLKELINDKGQSRMGLLFDKSLPGETSGTSIFNPVLAEVILKWFLPTETCCKVCDPFAGGAAFGFIAGHMGHEFTGIELRQEQVDLNNQRSDGLNVRYICDDGQNIASHLEKESQDLVFSCPPYFNLEKYSDLPNDASNKDFDGFIRILRNAFTGALSCLKQNRFAVIVMSNVRDKKGFYLDIVGEIIKIMGDNGARLYNELILADPLNTAAIRAENTFIRRKVVRVHQEILVFFKGDPAYINPNFSQCIRRRGYRFIHAGSSPA